MNRRDFIKTTGAAALASAAPALSKPTLAGESRMTSKTNSPNILFIMTDQQRADALGCVTPWFHTPHLDRLAAESAHFSNFFAQSPVCGPSRVNLITGRYPSSHGVLQNRAFTWGEPHIFRVLKKAGYHLGAFGKNHMLAKQDLAGFDREGLSGHHHPDDPPAWTAHLRECGERLKTIGCWAGACWHDFPEEFSSTARTGQAACDYLRTAPEEKPFMLWVSFSDPHAPHTAPRRFAKLYPEDRLPLPEGALAGEDLAEIKTKARRVAIKRAAQGMVAAPEAGVRRYRAVYAGMVSFVDEQVGKILAELERRNLAENTIVVFTSDHGDFFGDHGMVKKDLMHYDCLLNVPCMVRWPGRIRPARPTALVEQIDLMPTLLEACGVEIPRGVQGKSLLPLLQGASTEHREEIHAEVNTSDMRNPYPDFASFRADWEAAQKAEKHPLKWTAPFNVPGDFTKAIRTKTHKYIWYVTGEEELYDLVTDPGEKHNLASDPAQREQLADLRHRLLDWHVRSEDPLMPADRLEIEKTYPWPHPARASGGA